MNLYRLPDEAIVGGVCAGLSDGLGWDLFWTRIFMTFIVASNAIIYLALWLILPTKEVWEENSNKAS